MSSHNTRTVENSSDNVSISDAEVVPDNNSGSETPPSSPSFSTHNSDYFDEMNDVEDVQVSSNETHGIPESQGGNTDVPDDTPDDQPLRMMINRDSNNNTIEGETSQPAPASVVQTHPVVESATVDTRAPNASRRPKRTIRPRLQADQS